MAKKNTLTITAGTAWFLAILLISVASIFLETSVSLTVVWLILGICGAMVAIYNIRAEEESNFLIAIGALFIVVIAWSSVGVFGQIGSTYLNSFLINLLVGLGVAGFIVALGLIFKIAISK